MNWKREFEISIGPLFKRTYRLVATTAPVAYDYGYCLPLYDSGMRGSEAVDCLGRILAIPCDYADYQTARYSSGLYPWRELEDWEFDSMCESVPLRMQEAMQHLLSLPLDEQIPGGTVKVGG